LWVAIMLCRTGSHKLRRRACSCCDVVVCIGQHACDPVMLTTCFSGDQGSAHPFSKLYAQHGAPSLRFGTLVSTNCGITGNAGAGGHDLLKIKDSPPGQQLHMAPALSTPVQARVSVSITHHQNELRHLPGRPAQPLYGRVIAVGIMDEEPPAGAPVGSMNSGAVPSQPSAQGLQDDGEDGHDSHSFGGQVSPVSGPFQQFC
jgi:hypothetical protein